MGTGITDPVFRALEPAGDPVRHSSTVMRPPRRLYRRRGNGMGLTLDHLLLYPDGDGSLRLALAFGYVDCAAWDGLTSRRSTRLAVSHNGEVGVGSRRPRSRRSLLASSLEANGVRPRSMFRRMKTIGNNYEFLHPKRSSLTRDGRMRRHF